MSYIEINRIILKDTCSRIETISLIIDKSLVGTINEEQMLVVMGDNEVKDLKNDLERLNTFKSFVEKEIASIDNKSHHC